VIIFESYFRDKEQESALPDLRGALGDSYLYPTISNPYSGPVATQQLRFLSFEALCPLFKLHPHLSREEQDVSVLNSSMNNWKSTLCDNPSTTQAE